MKSRKKANMHSVTPAHKYRDFYREKFHFLTRVTRLEEFCEQFLLSINSHSSISSAKKYLCTSSRKNFKFWDLEESKD